MYNHLNYYTMKLHPHLRNLTVFALFVVLGIHTVSAQAWNPERVKESREALAQMIQDIPKLQAFKDLTKHFTQIVKDNEPDMKGYQWYFNSDETKCYLVEWHTSSESLLVHLQNIGGDLPKLLELSDLSRFEVFGNLSEDASKAVKGLGALVFGHFDGFIR